MEEERWRGRRKGVRRRGRPINDAENTEEL